MPQTAYTVIYATGGTDNAEWHRTLLAGTREEMQAVADAEARAGRPAYVRAVAELESIGLPEGPAPDWCYRTLRWRR